MKTMLSFLITSAALAGGVFAQQLSTHKVPASVKESFHSKFEGASKVEWKRKSDQNYEAEFKLKGVEVAAKFDQKGKWLETETTIEQSELTKDIRATISTDYKDYKIIETQKVERADDKQILFEVHLENAEEILKLQFEGNGTVSSKSAKRKRGP
jgi:Putative beta-lactamase-inhibitor-like, PepSY-like